MAEGYPALYISYHYQKIEKKLSTFGIPIHSIENLDDLREFIRDHVGMVRSHPLAVSDLSAVGKYVSHILKFVEECPFPLICLASRDNLPRVLLSRFMSIKKDPDWITNVSSSAEALADDLFQEDNAQYYSGVRKIARHFPQFLEVWNKTFFNHTPNRKKIIELMLRK